MNMKQGLEEVVRAALAEIGTPGAAFAVEYPPAGVAGDYSVTAPFAAGKMLGKSPRETAELLREALVRAKIPQVANIDIAGAGFLNITLSPEYFAQTIAEARGQGEGWGANATLSGKTIMVEYTDPNPFKEFHIGHLMTNVLGESVAHLLEHSGAKVLRANYYGDVGLHVPKAIWGFLHCPDVDVTRDVREVSAWGRAYQYGATQYEDDAQAKEEIDALNQVVYEQSDPRINALYQIGRQASLDKFEIIYKILGTKFDYYFPESTVYKRGVEIVRSHPEIFEESEGAVIFRGEKYGLHTRVFLNKRGLPTYDAKELGLAEAKRANVSFDTSISVTAVEQKEYFNVAFTALALLHPEWKGVFEHIHHGMMTLTTGKMSSRKGTVVTGESLLNEMIAAATEKMDGRELSDKEAVAQQVAVAAIKYSILKQSAGKNIVFDPTQSLSFEGDSGPYLQYAHARCCSVLRKGKDAGVEIASATGAQMEASPVAQLLARFPEIVERAAREYEPHFVTHYLIELAGAFNAWYANTRVLDGTDEAPAKLALTDAVRQTLRNGLWLLGCSAPEEM